MYPEARYGAEVPGTPGPAGPFAGYAEVKQGDPAPRSLVAVMAVGPLSASDPWHGLHRGLAIFSLSCPQS